MLWEILGIFLLNCIVVVLDACELTLGQKFHFLRPNDSYTHILSCVCDDSACQVVWVYGHNAFLIKTEVCEKFRVLFEMRCQLASWFISLLLIFCASEDLFVFEKASLRDEELHVVVDWEDHKVPIDDIQKLALHGNNIVCRVSSLHHIIKSFCSRILNL